MRRTLSLALFFPLHIFCQQQIDTSFNSVLNEVVVTATRTPRTMGNLAIPVLLINSKTLYQSGSLRLNDILSEQTGLMITDNFGKGIQMQGLSSEYTLVLLDGEPLIGRTGGVLDLSRITIRNIRKVEIIKGPSSSLYGSEAMGGVINIITDGAGQHKTDASIRFGRFGSIDGAINYARKYKKTDIQLASNYNRSEGYSLKPFAVQKTVEPFWKAAHQLNINHLISERWKAGAGLRFNNTHIDNSISVQNLGSTIISKGFEKNHEYNITPFIQYQVDKKIKSVLRGYITGFHARQQLDVKDAYGSYNDKFNQLFARVEQQTDIHPTEQSTLTLGAGLIKEQVSSNRYDSLSTLRNNQIAYLFAQHEYAVNGQLTIIGGVRFDANKAYASVLSPKFSFQYKLNRYLNFNASYGRGFKAPDFRQLYLNFTNLAAGAYSVFGTEVATAEINRMSAAMMLEQTTDMFSKLSVLKPETSGGLNLGVQYIHPQKIQFNLNLFRNDLSNMIVTDVIAFKKNGGQIYSYFNLKRALTQGAEINLSKQFINVLNIQAGYQYLYTADKDVVDAIKDGKVFQRNQSNNLVSRMGLNEYGGLPYRSRHSGNIKFYYQHVKGFFATSRLMYRGRWGTMDLDGNGLINRADEFAKGHLQLNCSAGIQIKQQIKLMAGVDNVLNYKDLINLPGNPGRVGYIDLQFNF
ncbi:MAG: TonB-dependent receptor plug domain-containing protein [Bacteroidota bacterium]